MESNHWLPLALPLAHRFQFILPDFLGFGHSGKTPFNLPKPLKQRFIDVLGDFFAAAIPYLMVKERVRALVNQRFVQKQMIPVGSYQAWLSVVRAYLENENYNLLYKLENIHIPVTIMAGLQNDMYPPEGSAYMHARIPNSKYIRFKKSGHTLIYTEPLKFIRHLNRFLA